MAAVAREEEEAMCARADADWTRASITSLLVSPDRFLQSDHLWPCGSTSAGDAGGDIHGVGGGKASPAFSVPDERSVDRALEVSMKRLGLPDSQLDQLRSLPVDGKWKIVQLARGAFDNCSREMKSHQPQSFVKDLLSPRGLSSRTLVRLRTCLAAEPSSWTFSFLARGGYDALSHFIDANVMRRRQATSRCVQSLLLIFV
ncbi:hypothetical protein DFJ73DRAFT_410878 [Zopfochytrium polystomum]|nr:hypothetical protein DFJ73DRAFT_410878 [Zopfochytrium polystomum]